MVDIAAPNVKRTSITLTSKGLNADRKLFQKGERGLPDGGEGKNGSLFLYFKIVTIVVLSF